MSMLCVSQSPEIDNKKNPIFPFVRIKAEYIYRPLCKTRLFFVISASVVIVDWILQCKLYNVTKIKINKERILS